MCKMFRNYVGEGANCRGDRREIASGYVYVLRSLIALLNAGRRGNHFR